MRLATFCCDRKGIDACRGAVKHDGNEVRTYKPVQLVQECTNDQEQVEEVARRDPISTGDRVSANILPRLPFIGGEAK